MKKLNASLLVFVILLMGSFYACQKDTENYPQLGEGPIDFTDYSNVALTIKAIDVSGNPLSGVKLEVSGIIAETNHLGVVIFNSVASANKQLKVKATKNGFAPAFYNVKVNSLNCYAEVALSPVTSHSFSTTSNNTVSFDNAEVTFSAGSFVDLNGAPYNGTVNVDFTYINPNQNNFGRSMPGGDFIGINSENEEQFLTSYGALSVELTGDNGQALQIADGYTSTLRMPVPNGYTNLPNQIPMWYFDEDKQVWIEEGKALLQGDKYIAEVSHFTWWNLDVPQTPNTFVEGYFVDCDGEFIEDLMISVGPVSTTTNNEGYFIVNVAANIDFTVSTNNNFSQVFVESVQEGETLNLGIFNPLEESCPNQIIDISTTDCFGKFIDATFYCDGCAYINSGVLEVGINQIEVQNNTTVTLMLIANGITEFIEFIISDEDIDAGQIIFCSDTTDDTTDDGTLDDATDLTDTTDDGTDLTDDGTLDDSTTDGTTDTIDDGFYDGYGTTNINFNECKYFTMENGETEYGFQFFGITHISQPETSNRSGIVMNDYYAIPENNGISRVSGYFGNRILDQSIGFVYNVNYEVPSTEANNAGLVMFVEGTLFLMKVGQIEIINLDENNLVLRYEGLGFNCAEISCIPIATFEEYFSTPNFISRAFTNIAYQLDLEGDVMLTDFSTFNSLSYSSGTICIPLE